MYYIIMPRNCDRMLEGVLHKGRLCRDVYSFEECEHGYICTDCLQEFMVKSSYYRHLPKCDERQQRLQDELQSLADKQQQIELAEQRRQQEQQQLATDVKRKVEELREKDIKLRLEGEAQFKEKLKSQIKQELSEELQQAVEQQVKTRLQVQQDTDNEHGIPTYNIDSTRYRSMGEDMYDRLVKKLGLNETVDYIHTIVVHKRPLDMFRKLYLEGVSYELYPVATKGSEMRYVDGTRELVSDKDGHLLGYLIQNSIQNALLKTAAAIAKQKLTYKDECPESNQKCDDFLVVQMAALDITRLLTRTDIIKSIKEWTVAPSLIVAGQEHDEDKTKTHPFFLNIQCTRATQKRFSGLFD